MVFCWIFGLCALVYGIVYISQAKQNDDPQARKAGIIFITIGVAVICLALYLSGAFGGDSDSGNHGSSSGSGGFIGSDGKYHPYVPEFGDDVNSWFENNW